MPVLQCAVCHKAVKQGDRFCSSCGTKIATTISQQQELPKGGAGTPDTRTSTQQKETPAKHGWHTYTNAWYGFVLEKPVDWEVRTTDGVIMVRPDDEGYLGATIRPLQLLRRVSAETVAQSLLGSMRQIIPALKAQGKPLTQDGAASNNNNMFSLRFQGAYNNVPIEGVFLIQILHDTSALISGFQAPSDKIAHLTPTLKRILASLQFIDRLPLQSYVEANEGAFSGFAPQGWNVRAMIQRTPDATRTPLVQFLATDPSGTASLTIPPRYEQYSENPLMAMSPGPIRYKPVMSASQYIQRNVLPNLQRSHQGIKVEGIMSRPDLAQRVMLEAQKDRSGLAMQCGVASIQYTFSRNGKIYREKDFIQVDHLTQIGTWIVKISLQMSALADQFAQQEPIFIGIIEAIQANEQWQNAEQARAAQVFNQAARNLENVRHKYMATLQNIQQQQLDIAQDMQAHTNWRIAAFDSLQEDFRNIINDRKNMVDPMSGKVYNVETGYNTYWAGDGDIYGTQNYDRSPKIGLHKLNDL